MAAPRSIPIRLDATGRNPRLAEFSNVCAALRTCLKQTSRIVLNVDKEVDFDIAHLEKGSAILEVVPSPNGHSVETLDEISALFVHTVHSLESDEAIDARLDYQALSSFRQFFSVINKDGLALSIGHMRLTEHYVRTLGGMLEGDSPSRGSAKGRLETVSLHKNHHFVLYPATPGEEIDCRFDPTMLSLAEVLKVVGKKITVFGVLRFAKAKSHPVSVDVESLQVEPEDSDLPNLLDIMGPLTDPHSAQARDWCNEW